MTISRRIPIVLLGLVALQVVACEVMTPTLSDREQGSFVGLGDFIAACYVGDPPARMHRHEYWDYGCYCGTGGAGTPVDATDECCKKHDECWAKVKRDTGTGCFWEGYDSNYNDPATGKPTTDCSKWTFAESCSRAKHPSNDKPEEEACCKCDLEAAQCFQRARPTYNSGYQDWSDNGDPGATCSRNWGKSYTCQSGYISRKTPCLQGTKRGNRLIGFWCETTCNKPQVCDTSTAAINAYARCAAAGTVTQTCATTLAPETLETLAKITDDETPCTDADCDECPNCTADSCTGNHAPPEEQDDVGDDEWPQDPMWDDSEVPLPGDDPEYGGGAPAPGGLTDAGVDAPADTLGGTVDVKANTALVAP